MPFLFLLVLFVALPLLELAILIKIGEYLGVAGTILLVVATGVMGVTLARLEGFRVFLRVQEDLSHGRMPAPHLLDGLMILMAGLLLVTPGLITDTVGFALLVPGVRSFLKQRLRGWLERKLRRGTVDVTYWEW